MATREDVTNIGITLGRHTGKPFGIRQPDRLLHVFAIGQTGNGKSSLLASLVRQDIEHGRGFGLIDPHGDLAASVAAIAGDRATYWNVADPACQYGYNPFAKVSGAWRPLVASGLISTLKQQWPDAWGARMEHLLRFAVLALLEQDDASIADVMPLFLDKEFREEVIAAITDEQVRQFWTVEYQKLRYQSSNDGVSSIANKVGAFLAHPVVRKAVCEPDQLLRFRQVMDEGVMLIVNLAKGRLGADISNLLGGPTYQWYRQRRIQPAEPTGDPAPTLPPLCRRVSVLHHLSLRRHAARTPKIWHRDSARHAKPVPPR